MSSVSSSLVTSSPTLGVRALSSALPTGSSSGVLRGKQFHSHAIVGSVVVVQSDLGGVLSGGVTWVN